MLAIRVVLALVFTILIEFLVYAVIIRKDYGRLIFYSILINSVTNPLLNFLQGSFNIIPLEILVFFAEIFLIKYLLEIDYKKAIGISFVANILSFVFGFFLLLFIFW